MRLLCLGACALFATLLPVETAAQLPGFNATTSNADALAWARGVLRGRTLSCVYVASANGSGFVHVDASTAAGRALSSALQTAAAGTPVSAMPGSLAGAVVDSLYFVASSSLVALNVSAVLPPSALASDPMATAAWVFSSLGGDCVLSPLAITAGTAANTVLWAHTPLTFLLLRPAVPGPSVFTLPLSWSAPFEWRLWATVGGFVLFCSAAHAALNGGGPRAVATALLGVSHPTAQRSAAATLHATACGFCAALLFAQYLSALSAMQTLPHATTARASALPRALCLLDDAAAWAAGFYPGASLTALPSVAALLSALPACGAALLTDADLAYAGGCGAPGFSAQAVATAVAALPLSLAWQGDAARALSVFTAAAQAPGGAFSRAAEQQMPGRSACAAAGEAGALLWRPTKLRDLSTIFLLQGAALLAAALLHSGAMLGAKLGARPGRGSNLTGQCPAAGSLLRASGPGGLHKLDVGDLELAPAAHQERPASSLALAAAVAQLHLGDEAASGDGFGWRGTPLAEPSRQEKQRAAAVSQLRAELLAVEADAAAHLWARAGTRSVVAAAGRGGEQPQQQFRSAPASVAGRFGGRPVLPRDGDDDLHLSTRL